MIEMKFNINNEKGFSLIEILIAVTVFAIGILAVGKMQMTAINANFFASGITEATTLAQDKMEGLICLSYADPLLDDTNGNGHAGIDSANATTADHNVIDGRYSIFWNIAPDHYIDNTKEIRIIVTWSDKEAGKKVSITSMKADII
jgi:type IV pilus assembly protein PilV